jgi:hypothetical protein
MAYRNYSTAVGHIVDTLGNGDFTTIGAALAVATSGQTIFIRPGTYTENPTLVAGVNLTAFGSDSSENGVGRVIISGTCSFSSAGTVTISGIELQTNAAAFLSVTGSVASIVNLQDCFLVMNSTGITFSSSSGSSAINIYDCEGNLATTGIAVFSHSSAGALTFYSCMIGNSGNSGTANTCSSGMLYLDYTVIANPITSSSTAIVGFNTSTVQCGPLNQIAYTHGGSNPSNAVFSSFASGTASAISISTNFVLYACAINSTNTDAITGAGSVSYQGLLFTNSGIVVNTTTQIGVGTLYGIRAGNAPSAGFLGEQIRSVVATPGLSLSNATPANITSISVTPGVWDISGVVSIAPGTAVFTNFQGSVNTTSNTLGSEGDNMLPGPIPLASNRNAACSIPSWRQTFSTTTTVYLVASINISSGSGATGFGRISATRVG